MKTKILACLAAVLLRSGFAESQTNVSIPGDQIVTSISGKYSGEGQSVTPTAMGDGAPAGTRLRCLHQCLEGEATHEGHGHETGRCCVRAARGRGRRFD